MNNWKRIWESRKDNLANVDRENYREVFAELTRIDGYDLNGGATTESLLKQYETLKVALRLTGGVYF